MVSPVDRAYGWQVKWKHRDIDDNHWQAVSFRRDEGQTRTDANNLCDFLDGPIQRRIPDTHPWIVERKYLKSSGVGVPAYVRHSFRQALEAYTETRVRTHETQKGVDWAVNKYFADWMAQPVGAITTAVIYAAWQDLTRSKDEGGWGLAESSARGALRHVLPALTFAYGEGWTDRDPVVREKLKFLARSHSDNEYTDEEPLRQEEYYKLLNVAENFTPKLGTIPDWWSNPLTPAETIHLSTEIMGETGARIGEVLAFAVEDVDFDKRLFHFDHHIVQGKRKPGTKAGAKAIRTVAFPEHMVPRLEKAVAGRPPREPLLLSAQRKFLRYNVWHSRLWLPFADQVEEAGILRSKVNFIPHLLRHSFATWTAPHVPAMVLMQIMGHARIATTQRYYRRVHEAVEVARLARGDWHQRHGQGHITAAS